MHLQSNTRARLATIRPPLSILSSASLIWTAPKAHVNSLHIFTPRRRGFRNV